MAADPLVRALDADVDVVVIADSAEGHIFYHLFWKVEINIGSILP